MLALTENYREHWQKWQFAHEEQQAFLIDLATLIEDGVSPHQAVRALTEIKEDSSVIVAQDILQKMAEGKPIADGMRAWFPTYIVEMIRVGEQTGTLLESLNSAGSALTDQSSIRGVLFSALTYPVVVLIAGCIVMVFIKHSILQVFAKIQPVSSWPTMSQHFYYFATWLEHWWWLLPAFGVLFFLSTARFLHAYIGEARHFLDKLPIIALYRRTVAARFMETLGLLINSGMVFKNALKILQQDADPYLASHMLIMEHRLGGGKDNIADVIDTGLIDSGDIVRLRVVAKGKGFDRALIRQGKYAVAKNLRNVTYAARIGGFLLLLLDALLAAYIIFSMYDAGAFISHY